MTEKEELVASLHALEKMKDIYENECYLCASYYTDMMDEINSQINDAKEFIKNIEKDYCHHAQP